MARHEPGPSVQNCIGLQSGGDVQVGIAESAIGETPLNIVNRMGRCNKAAFRVVDDVEHESTIGPELGDVPWRDRIAGENGAITSRKRETGFRVACKLSIKIRKDFRGDGNHDDAIEFSVGQKATSANAEKRLIPHPRLRRRADVSASIAFHLHPEIVPVGNVQPGWNWENRRRNYRASFLVSDQNSVDGTCRFLDLIELQVQDLLRRLDLIIGKMTEDGGGGGKGQLD